MIRQSRIEYVAFELFRMEVMRSNPRQTDKQIQKLWERERKGHWRDRAESAIAALKWWDELQEVGKRSN